MKRDYYTVKEFAGLLGYHPDTIYQWLRAGLIKYRQRLNPHSTYRIFKTELRKLKGKPPQDRKGTDDIGQGQPIRSLVTKNKEEHLDELRNLIKKWQAQLPPPSKLPYIMETFLRKEVPKQLLHETLEGVETSKLFEDAIEQHQVAHTDYLDSSLSIESDPMFSDLCQHLVGSVVASNHRTFMKQFAELVFEYGKVIGVIRTIIEADFLQQHYAEPASSIKSYEEIATLASSSKSWALVIGTILSCDFFTHALVELSPKTFGYDLSISLREARIMSSGILHTKFQNANQLSSDLASLSRVLWEDTKDPGQIRAIIREVLGKTEQFQHAYDELLTELQTLLTADPFPGKCSHCPDY